MLLVPHLAAPVALAAASATVVLTGCSVSFGTEADAAGEPTRAVPAAQVAKRISDNLAAQVGSPPDEVECPGALPAEVGAYLRCSLTHDGETLGIDVSVTGVDAGGEVTFDLQVDDAPPDRH